MHAIKWVTQKREHYNYIFSLILLFIPSSLHFSLKLTMVGYPSHCIQSQCSHIHCVAAQQSHFFWAMLHSGNCETMESVSFLTGFYPKLKSVWSCSHMNCCLHYMLHINLYILNIHFVKFI